MGEVVKDLLAGREENLETSESGFQLLTVLLITLEVWGIMASISFFPFGVKELPMMI